ncbi:hypothetical protein [Methyloterricola oryzae]|uniref:hypothetical protein n=1 Tax=Methyloterricola oryzae TaxID=1495050 RepID=UPI0005EB5480|nr:hypothetical protein [Methyloterricola oryzae]
MATASALTPTPTPTPAPSVNTISGKVMLAEPPAGIPNLLVVLYDVDPDTKPEESIARLSISATNDSGLNALGDRIGSVLTAADGSFSLGYEDSEYRIRNATEKRPDLLMLVLAPETPGKALKDLILFFSPEVRQDAGRIESYFVQLTVADLKKAGLPLPEVPTTPGTDDGEADLVAFEGKLKAGKRYFERKADILKQQIEVDHAQYVQERTTTFSVNVKEELSKVPKAVRDSVRFVNDNESVQAKALHNTKLHIKNVFNEPPAGKPRATASGFIYLTEAQIAKYQPFVQGDEFVLPSDIVQDEILPALFGGNNSTDGSANDFLMDHPQVRTCMRLIKGDITCEGHDHDPDGTPVPTPTPTPGPILLAPDLAPAQPSDVFDYIATQMEHVTAPEGVLNFGVESKSRASLDQIGQHITGLHFTKGPADSPALFDFHTLNIAFEHVWKEATDLGILQQGEALYDQVVGVGQKPTKLKDLILNISSTVRFLKLEPQQQQSQPPPAVIFEFPDAVDLWNKMSTNEQSALTRLTSAMLGKYHDTDDGNNNIWLNFLNGATPAVPFINKGHLLDRDGFDVIAAFRQKGQRLLDNVCERVEQATRLKTDLDSYTEADSLAQELNQKLKERYSFTYFAADSVERSINFGVLLTYRQEWNPAGYSAGELVRTIPLAPKEVRKYSKRTLVKKSRSQKEIEDNLRITKTDTSDTSRAESEIVNKALNKSTFAMNSTSTFDIPIGEVIKIGANVSTNFSNEAQRESNQTKKDFRESVIKAAQEYKTERRVEISTDTSEERENTESGEISNPNDELTVTYLFYELQRQFRVNERLHRMRPVVLVAQEMPAPHEIDDEWLTRHDWIIKRALLDDSFVYAFDCIVSVRGDILLLRELERTVLEQRKIVRDLRQNVRYYTDETGRMSRLMQAAINKEADIAEDRDFWDGIPLLGSQLDSAESAIKGVGSLLGFGKGDDPKEAQRIRREGIKDAYERADRERRELMGRLEHETSVLNGLTKEVAEKRKDINEKEILIARLKSHVKDHILHYMQAIWSYEHPDQRFFRLFNTKVPQLSAPAASYNLRIKTTAAIPAPQDAVANLNKTGTERKIRHPFYCRPIIDVEEKTLAEVADLDNLLGFKGNYMIFPLLKSNVLTDFMMAPYVDSEFGLLDPDALGNWTLEEFEQLYCCLKEKMSDDEFSEIEPALKEFYKQLLTDPLRPGELITVPTGSLFIEALPGEHPILENFKALHRAVDVKKAQADVRRAELENIRYAARVMAGERGDPDVEKKIVVEGTGVIVNPDT